MPQKAKKTTKKKAQKDARGDPLAQGRPSKKATTKAKARPRARGTPLAQGRVGKKAKKKAKARPRARGYPLAQRGAKAQQAVRKRPQGKRPERKSKHGISKERRN